MENNRKEAEKTTKEEGGMYVLLLEVLHDLVVYKDPCINIDINKIIIVCVCVCIGKKFIVDM
jgi:hypothetical protein